jgi:putative transposase
VIVVDTTVWVDFLRAKGTAFDLHLELRHWGQIFIFDFGLFSMLNDRMARPLRISYPHAFYHVTCRGNDRRNIYGDDHDRSAFLEKLRMSVEIYAVKVHAYVLMANHFHLIVETPKANLSEFMRHFNIAYTGAYNRRHKRVGHLYQGRYKGIVVEKDSYLLELSRYVHLNPVRVMPHKRKSHREQLRYLEKYLWSSLGGYLTSNRKQGWMIYGEVLSQVGGSERKYGQFIEEGIQRGYDTPWENLKGQVALGKEEFLGKLKGKLDKTHSKREQPSARALDTIHPATVLNRLSRYLKINKEDLTRKRTTYRNYRAIGMELLYRHCKISQAEIGQRMGNLDYSTVSRERKRLREQTEEDRKLQRSLAEIDSELT